MRKRRRVLGVGTSALMALAPLIATGALNTQLTSDELPAVCTQATPGGTVVCQYTSLGQSTFDVPAGVTNVQVTAIGATGGKGGNGGGTPGSGGLGAKVVASLTVTPSSILYVEVGVPGSQGTGSSQGVCSAGAGGGGVGSVGGMGGGVEGSDCTDNAGGGGGGGASDVQTVPVASEDLTGTASDPRLVVAGGGGGGAGGRSYSALTDRHGGNGGNAGDASVTGAGDGGNSGACSNDSIGFTGNPGGVGAGAGLGGTSSCQAHNNGSVGSPTSGGAGAEGSVDAGAPGAGGGGGGYIGGGGGGVGVVLVPPPAAAPAIGGGGGATPPEASPVEGSYTGGSAGGGGGGSSFAPTGATITTAAAGVPSSVTIAYTPVAQTIALTVPSHGTVGGTGTLSATGGGSGNPVTFTSTTPAVCTVSGDTVKYIAAGTCTIEAMQIGNTDYASASSSQSITVGAAPTPTAPPSPKPVHLITGPPQAPSNTSPLLPVGVGVAALGLGGMAAEVVIRRRKKHLA